MCETALIKIVTPGLAALRAHFVDRGFDIRVVGGAVRDILLGQQPKDVDLCTDATPDEQIDLYREHEYRFFETGLHHGTLTVLVEDVPIEITTLRTETDHDGRHAVVRYTRDWAEDLGRRDLTVNAMALTFDGHLVDPFDGFGDLMEGRVRFVGNPEERMTEDYLRILRWLRFHARLSPMAPLNEDAEIAARKVGNGLARISRERVWSEASRMMASRAGVNAFANIHALGLQGFIDLPDDVDWEGAEETAVRTGDPVAAIAALLEYDENRIGTLAQQWRWSGEERDRGLFLARRYRDDTDVRAMVARDELRRDWVVLLCRARGHAEIAERLEEWVVPVFPVSGNDFLAKGQKPGRLLGMRLRELREYWADTSYMLTRSELLRCIDTD